MTSQQTRERRPCAIPTARLIHVQPAAARHPTRYGAVADMEPTIRGIEVALLTEFACMSRILRHSSRSKRLEEIHGLLEAALQEIQHLILEGGIQPWKRLHLSKNELEPEPCRDPVRVGVYPLAGNPLHWGDILSGLTVMAKARLDKVVYVIVDDGEKNADLLPAETRRAASRDVLAIFDPLLVHSNMAGGHFDPIKDISSLYALNPNQKLDVYYVACTGHRLAGQEVSTARIRETLCGARDPDVLSALPYSVFRHMAGGDACPAQTHKDVKSKGLIEKGVM
jgi:hypothetical protein